MDFQQTFSIATLLTSDIKHFIMLHILILLCICLTSLELKFQRGGTLSDTLHSNQFTISWEQVIGWNWKLEVKTSILPWWYPTVNFIFFVCSKLTSCFLFSLKSSTSSSKHLSKHSLTSYSSSYSITMSIRVDIFVPDPSASLLVISSVFLTIYSMIYFVCDAIASMIVLVLWSVEENPLLSISSCSWLMIFSFRDYISHSNPSISGIRIICGGVSVN